MTPESVSDWAKTAVAVLTLLTSLAFALRKAFILLRKLIVGLRLQAKAVRYLLDAVRHILFHIPPSVHGDNSELGRQKLLIDQVRDELWVFDGNESERDAKIAMRALVKEITRTQRIEASRARRIREEIEHRRLSDGR